MILVRILPRNPKVGDEVQVSAVIQHPMESGYRLDENNKRISANYITVAEVYFNNVLVARLKPRSGVSTNPSVSVYLKPQASGEVRIRYVDMVGYSQEVRQDLVLSG
jgi:sulfur-oxidizing protein SoxZ